jgi:hypothetical protein
LLLPMTPMRGWRLVVIVLGSPILVAQAANCRFRPTWRRTSRPGGEVSSRTSGSHPVAGRRLPF